MGTADAAPGTMQPPVTAEELSGLLGETDPAALERILETGASFDEVAEALGAIEDEDASAELHHAPSSERAAQVREILEALVLEPSSDARR